MRTTIPEELPKAHESRIFTKENTPKALLTSHKSQRWAILTVLKGQVIFTDEKDNERVVLNESDTKVIVPLCPHHVELDGESEFFLTFYGDQPTKEAYVRIAGDDDSLGEIADLS